MERKEKLLAEIEGVGRVRQIQLDELGETEKVLHEKIVKARLAGVSKLQLAKASGLSRPTIYAVLGRAGIYD